MSGGMDPTKRGVWIEARDLRPSDALDFRSITADGVTDGLPVAKLKRRQGRIEVDVVLDGVPRHRVFAPTDRVCIIERCDRDDTAVIEP